MSKSKKTKLGQGLIQALKEVQEPKKLHELIKENNNIVVPYHVWTVFGDDTKVISYDSGGQASLGCDYKSLTELRNALQWYVEQLGGKVKWE